MEGRIRQANRMKTFADFEKQNGRWVICDFVAPTEKANEQRRILSLILLSGWILLKKVGLKIQIKCLNNQIKLTLK